MAADSRPGLMSYVGFKKQCTTMSSQGCGEIIVCCGRGDGSTTYIMAHDGPLLALLGLPESCLLVPPR